MSEVTGFPPKVFIIGAQKAGTTQLSELLQQHPDVCLSDPKEPDYFTRFYDKGESWYMERFSDPDKCLIDASTSYTCRPLPNVYSEDHNMVNHPLVGVPERIHKMSPDAKLIYIVRDPVKRCYSGYWHQVRAGIETDPLEKAVMKNTYYRRISKYAEQLEYYLQYFSKDQILLLEFEELIKQPQSVVVQVLEFIGLPPMPELSTDLHKNKSFQYAGPLHTLNVKMARFGGLAPIVKGLKKLIPDALIERLKGSMSKPVPSITDEQKAMLSEMYEDEKLKVRRLLAKD